MRKLWLLMGLLLVLSGCGSSPKKYASDLAKAQEALAAGDYGKALSAYKSAVKDQPGSEEALRGITVALEQTSATDADKIKAYEALRAAGELTAGEYRSLGQLYLNNQGSIMARSLLEKSYRLDPQPEVLALLDGIYTDLSTEEGDLAGEAKDLAAKLQGEDPAGVRALITSAEWNKAAIPQGSVGDRKYYQLLDGGQRLYVMAGLISEGSYYTKVWYQDADRVRYCRAYGKDICEAELKVSGGQYNGEYHLVYARDSGVVYDDQGTLKDGILDGTLNSKMAAGNSGDVLKLIEGKDALNYTEYNGSFTAGKTTAAQHTDVTGASGIAYAYSSDQKHFIYLTAADGKTAADYIFTSASFGIDPLPDWQAK